MGLEHGLTERPRPAVYRHPELSVVVGLLELEEVVAAPERAELDPAVPLETDASRGSPKRALARSSGSARARGCLTSGTVRYSPAMIRAATRSSWRTDASPWNRRARTPQPMSPPMAAGNRLERVATTVPTHTSPARCASGMIATRSTSSVAAS